MGGERATSYAEFADMSARLAAWLKNKGIGREKLAAIRVPRGVHFIACRFAVMMVGGAWIGVEDMMGTERIEYIIKDSGAQLTIDEECFFEAMKEEPLPPEQWADPDPHDMAFVFYTSGSTGRAKGVVQEYGIYRYVLASTARTIEGYTPLNYANIAPETFIGGLYLMTGILCSGNTLHIIPLPLVRDPAGLLDYFKKHEIQVTCMPPTLVRALEAAGGMDLKILHITGEIASDLFTDRFPMMNAYGPTEFSYLPFLFTMDRAYKNTPIGKPDQDTQVILLDEDGRTDPKEGLMCIYLPYFRGYLHDKEGTGFIDIEGRRYFKSGDYMAVDGQGNYTILGRVDDMVKINGNRIEPSEVESVIKKVLDTDFAAVKVWERGGSRYLCAYHTCDKELNAAKMAEKLKDSLPLYMIPACYVRLDAIPLNENGKVDKTVLPRPDESALFAPYAAPENALQKKLCEAFADALKIDRASYGIDDDFFLLGGDSLAAIRVVTAAGHSALTVFLIYKERTVRSIDRALQGIHTALEGELPEKDFPLTVEQKFFLERELELPGGRICNQPLLLSFSPDIDEVRLSEAVRQVFSAHPALLTVVRKKGGNYLQQMIPDNNAKPAVETVSEKELQEEVNEAVQPFSFDGSPLFRRRLFRTPERVVLFLDIHHMICDGYSLRIVVEDILSAYEGRELHKDAWLQILNKITLYGGAQGEDDRKYFELTYGSKYDGGQYDLLPAFDTPEEGHGKGEVIHPFSFEKQEVYKTAQRLRLSVNAFYLLSAALSLMAYNRSENILILWTFNGRAEAKAMRTVGILLQDYPVTLSLNKAGTVLDTAASINRQIREALRHGSVTQFIGRGREEPLDFLYQGGLLKMPDFELLTDIDYPEVPGKMAIEPMELQLYEDEDGPWAEIIYDAGLYRSESMERFANIYESVCRLLIAAHSEKRLIRDIIPEVSDIDG